MKPTQTPKNNKQFRVFTTNRWLYWVLHYFPDRKENPYTTMISLCGHTVSEKLGVRKFHEFEKYYGGVQFNHDYDFIKLIPKFMADDMPEELKEIIAEEQIEEIIDQTPKPVPQKYVYFIGFGDYIKIGISVDVQKRINELQTGCPEKIVYFGHIIGDEQIERKYHSTLKQFNTNGEWFKIQFPDAIEHLDIKDKVIIL